MTLPVTAWKCLFIYKSDEALCPTYAHIVGPSPHPLLLEVAVPLHTVVTRPYVVVSQDITASIDHMVTQEKKDKLGYIVAYQEMLLWFVRTAREGIRRHGASLGDYYRHRYPNFRSWVEYAVLLQDLPSASLSPHSSEREVQFRDAFAQAASFLAFDAMKPHETISEELQQMDSTLPNIGQYLPDPWVSRLSLQQKRSFEALVEEASALSDQAKHPYNIQQLFVIWTYTQGSSARSCQKEIKPQSRQLFKVAARHLANSESRTQIVLDAMTSFCITRLFMEHEPRKQILDTLDRFDAILNTGYQADTPLVLDYCLVSLHRVLVASDFLGRSVHLANFVAQLRLPQLMLGMNDCHMDIYWSQRLLSRRSHLCALNATHQQVGLSIKLAPLQLDDEASDDCITVKVDDQIVSLSQDTDTLILLEDEMGRRSNEEEDLREMANMALRLEARRRRKSTAKELKRSSGSRRLGERYKHNQLVRR
ncbi:hypothetical protein FOMA001_g19838 [Fusarium oxysporum f. sp. matthiolae]|nr:hypothetical protein FOMA001_g19838 [Fusarium oxysporum f. sp. matthiolae]